MLGGVGGQVTTRLFGMCLLIPFITYAFFCFNTLFDAEIHRVNNWNKQGKICIYFWPPPNPVLFIPLVRFTGYNYMKLNNYFYKLHNN